MTIQPNITSPLVRAPEQTVNNDSLGALKWFLGTWNSPKGEDATGYNVMSLPQSGAPNGYILKNMPYYEEITFAAIAGGVTNRGGDFAQNNNTLFYEQRVFIANNPAPAGVPSVQDTLVHAENGSWLYRTFGQQLVGAYGPDKLPLPSPTPVEPTAKQYVKQASIPHGNSLLLVGDAVELQGAPVIPATTRDVLPFTDPAVIDPNTKLTEQLQALQSQGITVIKYIKIEVSNNVAGGGISNVLFEHNHADVDCFDTTWYIEFLSNGTIQIQYHQFIWMKLLINGQLVRFLHSDANTLLPVSGQVASAD
jgi:hypothetical protein